MILFPSTSLLRHSNRGSSQHLVFIDIFTPFFCGLLRTFHMYPSCLLLLLLGNKTELNSIPWGHNLLPQRNLSKLPVYTHHNNRLLRSYSISPPTQSVGVCSAIPALSPEFLLLAAGTFRGSPVFPPVSPVL